MKFTKEIIETIKQFVIDNIESHTNDISSVMIKHFGITKPTAIKYVSELVKDKIIEKTGKGRYPKYKLKSDFFVIKKKITKDLEEDVIWLEEILPKLQGLSENVREICQYGFTEMVNNVIDHSEGKCLEINLLIDYKKIMINIIDDGVGIFNKIKNDLKLSDPKFAILELAKGKFTSDPKNHSGEGIFFTSRMFYPFIISSAELTFLGNKSYKDLLFESKKDKTKGTFVFMCISKKSNLSIKKVFDEYADPDKIPGFHKTVVPVKLMEYEGESLLSRSQAKRLSNRFDHFLEVVLDFEGVKIIGQAFADQIFRVFANAHPNVNLEVINVIDDVQKMINYVKSNKF